VPVAAASEVLDELLAHLLEASFQFGRRLKSILVHMIDSVPEVLAGPSITLRRYRLTDAAALKESALVSHEHLRRYMPWAMERPTDDSVMDFVRSAAEEFRTSGNANYAITRTSDGAYLGGCGIHDRVGPGALEIGYWVDVRHVRQGITTAAAQMLTDACFAAGVDRVVIRCDPTNEASVRVARALGFELVEVRVRDEILAASETGETMVWAKHRGTGAVG
jgi:RimJ/RimL family protein N-acetyltransferase